MNGLNPQIPLSVAQQPTMAQQMGGALEMAGAYEKHQEMQQQRQDQQIIQEALKAGANFNTPEGLAATAEQLKGKVSPKTYQLLTQATEEAKFNQAKTQEYYARLPEEILKGEAAQTQTVMQQLEGGIVQYQNDLQEVGQQEADRRYAEYKKSVLPQLAQQKMPNGQPLYQPKILQKYAASNVKQDESAMLSMKYKQDQIKSALDIQEKRATIELKKQEAATSKAREADIKKGKGVSAVGWDELTPERQEQARTIAQNSLITGRTPPARGGSYELGMIGMRQIAAENGMSVPELMAAGADVKTQLQAKPVVEKRIQALERAENQLELEIPVMEDAMKQLSLPSIPLAARGKIAVLRQLGDPNVAKLDQAADVVFNEFETVKTGNPGALYVSNMEAAKENYHKVQTPQQMKAWIDGARRIIKNAKASNQKTREDINKNILQSLKMQREEEVSPEGKKPEQPAVVPRKTAPAGAIEKLKANPQLKDQFKAKYGYLPEGF